MSEEPRSARLLGGFRPTNLPPETIERIRGEVARGAVTHECGEWLNGGDRCLLCDAVLHDFIPWIDFHRAPIDAIDPILHTAFKVLVCTRCNHAEVFPRENYVMTLPGFREALTTFLANFGYMLAGDP